MQNCHQQIVYEIICFLPSVKHSYLDCTQNTSLLICWLDKQTTSWLVWLIQFPGCPLPVCQSTSSQKNQCFRSLIIKTCYPVQLRNRSHDSCHAAAGDVACCKRWDECVSKRAAILPKALSVVLCWEIWLNYRLRPVWLAVCHCVFPPHFFFSQMSCRHIACICLLYWCSSSSFFFNPCCLCHWNVFGLFLCLQFNSV